MNSLNRIFIAAPSSGSGKTMVTCGLLMALKLRKIKARAFKCGPDYIDPMFHKKVLGISSKNLDTYFTDFDTTRYLFENTAREYEISVIEGVMGFYDGIGGNTLGASSYECARTIEAPVILTVNAKGMSLSVIPIIKGFLEYKTDSNIKGVILNNTTKAVFLNLKRAIEEQLNIKVLGYVPYVSDLAIESRHLGLVMPKEVEKLEERIIKLANILEETVDIDEIIEISKTAPKIYSMEKKVKRLNKKITIAMARDEAFCFYYEDNLELLRKLGAEILEFSPMRDSEINPLADLVIFGGGYPELYAKELSENISMQKSVKAYAEGNGAVIAECGGFMYLHEYMEDINKKKYKMAGVIKGEAFKTDRLNRFGYIELMPNACERFIKSENRIKGHEFHYFDSTSCGEAFLAKKPNGLYSEGRSFSCIAENKNVFAGFPHLYYYSNIDFVYELINAMTKNK